MSRSAVPASPTAPPDVLADLERRLTRVESFVGVPAAGAQPRRPAPEVPPRRPDPEPAAQRAPAAGADRGPGERAEAPTATVRVPSPPMAAPGPVRVRLDEALVGGRLLAWAGGAALLFALGTLFWLGVRDGWLGEELRCLIGAVASAGLLAAGLRNARSGVAREASWAMAGTGLAGLYATGAVATATYDLLPGLLGLPALAALGVASALLALRWDAPPLAGVGLLGALAAPVIAPVDGLVLPVVVVAMAATGLLLRHRPWTWLAAAATVLALPQVVWHVGSLLDDLGDASPFWTVAAPGLAVVATLAAGLAMVAGWELRNPQDRERWSMPLLLVVHAAVAAALGGGYALVDRPAAAVVTLAASAALLGGAAWRVRRRSGSATPVELVLLSVAVLVVDLGFAIAASGLLQLVGWALTAVAFALLARHAARVRMPVLIGGLGLHAGLTLLETVGASGGSDGGFLVACAVLAAVCGVSARVIAPRSEEARMLLDLAALAVAFWWTVATLPGDRIALVLATEAAALLLIDRRVHDVVARGAGLLVLAVAAGVALLHADGAALLASWGAVPDGELGDLVLPLIGVALAAGAGISALSGVIAAAVRPLTAEDAATEATLRSVRGVLAGTAGGLGLLAASILVGHLATSLAGGTDAAAVARDVLWAATGLGLLAAGLARVEAPLRMTGLTFLAGIGLKIALIDLADVGTGGRVVAWAALGALLLVGAGLYARLRPEDDARRARSVADEADLRASRSTVGRG
ncbi:DUF2339 domain-containing protein [Patulibacter sp. NPDC049589]|uniref:DUF2339 domain-containing protein n=1 Tax=Patulibacter sp. NPDC049589 TaxID=3154731 RepID=UPI00344A01ED